MQTFITDFDLEQSAQNLDNKRLGKQRVEAIQIANCLLIKESAWKNHPAVKMWKGYEIYLIRYIYLHLIEWEKRGYKNIECWKHYYNLLHAVTTKMYIQQCIQVNVFSKSPEWLTDRFIEAHRSNLIRKNSAYYKPLFSKTKEGLDYIWPV